MGELTIKVSEKTLMNEVICLKISNASNSAHKLTEFNELFRFGLIMVPPKGKEHLTKTSVMDLRSPLLNCLPGFSKRIPSTLVIALLLGYPQMWKINSYCLKHFVAETGLKGF